MTDTNLDKLNRFGKAAVFAKDADDALKIQQSLLHEDFEIIEAPGLPYGGTYRGLKGWGDLIATIKTIWNPVRVTPLWTIGDPNGDQFGKMYRVSGASSVTGKTFDTTIFELWEFKDGKIIRTRPYYWDTHELNALHKA
ncbi:MAG: nuclear transport factor 2 family protein [Candidatus Brevundimonas colombiensis]|uniref:Nuclear transport factor 2 family protein n=1 Tax=Candidatus Brevundimonas colombiensis TaxID=3121376 RepID=A0AAJ6BN76_9CAUL|nr:nuclear transport factor 2 family protein [Brevundimonas sp.]WEK41481.1 MAG: nuclear transport factor 2 family protein [Brevundimonas sp.]